MTKKQRAQVVELLRCAADVCAVDSSHGLYSGVGIGSPVGKASVNGSSS